MVTAFNESVYHPDTSLKYHTMLVVALLDNYRTGNEFPDLRLIVDSTGKVSRFAPSSTARSSHSETASASENCG